MIYSSDLKQKLSHLLSSHLIGQYQSFFKSELANPQPTTFHLRFYLRLPSPYRLPFRSDTALPCIRIPRAPIQHPSVFIRKREDSLWNSGTPPPSSAANQQPKDIKKEKSEEEDLVGKKRGKEDTQSSAATTVLSDTQPKGVSSLSNDQVVKKEKEAIFFDELPHPKKQRVENMITDEEETEEETSNQTIQANILLSSSSSSSSQEKEADDFVLSDETEEKSLRLGKKPGTAIQLRKLSSRTEAKVAVAVEPKTKLAGAPSSKPRQKSLLSFFQKKQ